MKRLAFLGYLSLPSVLAAGTFVASLMRKPFEVEMFVTSVLGGFLFYAAPHFLWTAVAALVAAPRALWHAGFVACTVSLVAIASLWLAPQDPSGLPLQWAVYWPLAIMLLFVFVGGTAAYLRFKKTSDRQAVKRAAQ
jgi:hypothetical protein